MAKNAPHLLLASVALKGASLFVTPSKGDNVKYWFIPDYQNAQQFMNGNAFLQYDKGDGIIASKKMVYPLTGTFYLGLLNDNIKDGINVIIKGIAVTTKKNWQTRAVKKYKVKKWQIPYLKN